jgi:uncharacterized SAM-binding protein YcdF (DUF218 family)
VEGPAADAIVVLGGRITPSGRPAAPTARRVAAGASAFLAGLAPWIVVSGGRRWGSAVEARVMRVALEAAGVPTTAVIEELCSLSTHENAIFSAAILARLPARRVALVTCPWHLPRAVAAFRATGLGVVPFPAAHPTLSLPHRLYLEAHERVCSAFDARSRRRADVLTESAARHCAGLSGPRGHATSEAEVEV